jgi:hypothetical protein
LTISASIFCSFICDSAASARCFHCSRDADKSLTFISSALIFFVYLRLFLSSYLDLSEITGLIY